MTIEDIRLEQTCGACPEQYDAFIGENLVGYLRLRHGYFYVAYPTINGEVIYEANPKGDGIFEDDEREKYLTEAKQAILEKAYPEAADEIWNELGAYIHRAKYFKWYSHVLKYLKENYILKRKK